MKVFFVFNPRAGKERIKNKLGDIIELFSMDENDITIRATKKRGDATELVKNLPEGYDRVICAGGDGTLDEVVEGMRFRKNRLPIGYIPAGSTNDFAMSLGISSRIMDAAKTAIGNNLLECDYGLFNDRAFVYVAAFGAFTEVSYETPQKLKNRLGHAAYVLEALKKLTDIRSYKMHIETDTMTIDDEFIYGMITNSDSVGGIKRITGTNVNLSDGLFEVTLIRKPELATDMNHIMAALLNRDYSCKDVYYFKTDRILLESEENVLWTLDGEYGGDEKSARIENVNKELKIYVK